MYPCSLSLFFFFFPLFVGCQLKAMMHDALCRSADEIFENQRDLVHTKVRYESDEEGDDTIENNTVLPGAKSKVKSNKQKTQTDDILQVDDFAIGVSSDGSFNSSSIRYMDDWSGVLTDADGSNSIVDEAYGDDDAGELDDQYFEMRRQEASDESDHDGDDAASENGSIISENDTENEDENDMEMVEASAKLDTRGQEGDEENDDTFMEVGTETEGTLRNALNDHPGDMAIDTFDEDDGSAEEDMEEVDLA